MKRSVCITVKNNDKVLVVTNRRFGGFTLPGGKTEDGELQEEAAFRELYEETGILPNALKYLGSSLFKNPCYVDAPTYVVSHFRAIVDKPMAFQMEEGTMPSWKHPSELLNSKESIFREHYGRVLDLGIFE